MQIMVIERDVNYLHEWNRIWPKVIEHSMVFENNISTALSLLGRNVFHVVFVSDDILSTCDESHYRRLKILSNKYSLCIYRHGNRGIVMPDFHNDKDFVHIEFPQNYDAILSVLIKAEIKIERQRPM